MKASEILREAKKILWNGECASDVIELGWEGEGIGGAAETHGAASSVEHHGAEKFARVCTAIANVHVPLRCEPEAGINRQVLYEYIEQQLDECVYYEAWLAKRIDLDALGLDWLCSTSWPRELAIKCQQARHAWVDDMIAYFESKGN